MSYDLAPVRCNECATVFGMSEGLLELRKKDAKLMWCPLGHTLSWGGETKESLAARIAKLSDELAAVKKDLAAVTAERDRLKSRCDLLEVEAKLVQREESR